MATYGRPHQIIISGTIELLKDQIQRDMFDGADAPTRIRSFSASGTVDPFTEEITYHTSHIWSNVSGIIGTIAENDLLLGLGGKIKIGDAMIVYPYTAISGIYLQQRMREIEVLVPGVSGLYLVAGTKVQELAGHPMFLRVALARDMNG